jgi:hypothetical protein
MLKIEFGGQTTAICQTDSAASVATALEQLQGTALPREGCLETAQLQRVLQLPVDPHTSPALDVGVLLAMMVAIRVGVYLVLRHKTKPI